MNKSRSELNKTMQLQLKKKETFPKGIKTLLALRKELMEQMLEFKKILTAEQFSAIPFINANGYHCKTVAYSLWHIIRIEDIVTNTMIKKDRQVFFTGDYQQKINSPIITTGNELVKQVIADFSSQLDIDGLYNYIADVDKSTTKLLQQLTFEDMKIKMTESDKDAVRKTKTVSESENAVWLIDYWGGKDIRGLIQMPLSRHWIMHIEAAERIANKLTEKK
ncbi:MAG: phage head-tail adapter protein [Eubacterium sp.]|nr:phage head-tail adapter protein [Eubacterium sp.]